jgi:hypothetical protein
VLAPARATNGGEASMKCFLRAVQAMLHSSGKNMIVTWTHFRAFRSGTNHLNERSVRPASWRLPLVAYIVCFRYLLRDRALTLSSSIFSQDQRAPVRTTEVPYIYPGSLFHGVSIAIQASCKYKVRRCTCNVLYTWPWFRQRDGFIPQESRTCL